MHPVRLDSRRTRSGFYLTTPWGVLYIGTGNRKLRETGPKLRAHVEAGNAVTTLTGAPLALRSRRRTFRIGSFNLPAGAVEINGRKRITCPGASLCLADCYAQAGAFNYPDSIRVRVDNFTTLEAMRADRVSPRDAGFWLATLVWSSGVDLVRPHDSGDFYALWYAAAWAEAVRWLRSWGWSGVVYGYSKSITYVRAQDWGPGVVWTLSVGGRMDHLIDPGTDRHAAVFASHEERIAAGYTDGTDERKDLPAIIGEQRIGLVFHNPNRQESSDFAEATRRLLERAA